MGARRQRTLVIIGSGLAGSTAALTAAELNPKLEVIIIEKEAKTGGNSVKASSGINSITPESGDSEAVFKNDTLKSGGGESLLPLVTALVEDSTPALAFLESHGAHLDSTVQLGGHSVSRSHTPSTGPNVGFAIMSRLGDRIAVTPNIKIITNAKVTGLSLDNGKVTGITYNTSEGDIIDLEADAVILATGGFGAAKDFLKAYAPEAVDLPTTSGHFATGDGLRLAQQAGGVFTGMEHAVQVHPTGFVDPEDYDNQSKILAPEKLRGVGGILLASDGHRFINELTTRDVVAAAIMKQPKSQAFLLLDELAVKRFGGAIGFYKAKGLMQVAENIEQAAGIIGIDANALREEIAKYNTGMESGSDAFEKSSSFSWGKVDPESTSFYIATVTPVVHYSQGGVQIDENAHVVDENGKVIPGLFAAGEVTGGVHGANRLGGNSLLDCVVFGRRAGLAAESYSHK